jgi:NADH-quinone oxidoreductase subunit L
MGVLVATLLYRVNTQWPEGLSRLFPRIYAFSLNKWYMDELYDHLFVGPGQKMGRFLWHRGDQAFIDTKLINHTASWAHQVSKRLSQMHTGLLFHYSLWMGAGIGLMFLYLLFIESVSP